MVTAVDKEAAKSARESPVASNGNRHAILRGLLERSVWVFWCASVPPPLPLLSYQFVSPTAFVASYVFVPVPAKFYPLLIV